MKNILHLVHVICFRAVIS